MAKSREERLEEIISYTPRETAKILKVHVQTLANWRAGRGDVNLPFVKQGKSVRYRHQDIVTFQSGRLCRSTAEAAND